MSILIDPNTAYQCDIIKILDGDTIDFYVNLGMGAFQNARVRFENISAPEIYGVSKSSEEFSKGMVAFTLVKEFFYEKTPPFYVRANHKDIYGRWLGEIWRAVGEESLNDYMISLFYYNGAWTWYSQERLIEDWYDGKTVITPSGKVLPIWHNWGKESLLDGKSKMIKRINQQ